MPSFIKSGYWYQTDKSPKSWLDLDAFVVKTAAVDEKIKNFVSADLVIKTVADLAPYLSGDEYILPTGLVVLNYTVDLGDKAIRLSTNTVLRGFGESSLISTVPNGVVRATNIGSPIILREFNVIALGGPAFVLEGTLAHQLNIFFVGMIGVKAAYITGFQVQSFKQCFVDAADGITSDGITNKIFLSECPFYNIVGSAVTFASTLVCEVADIVTSFYKFDAPGVGITAEPGYSIIEGLVRGSLKVGTATPLVGLAASELNWTMVDNSGIANSRIVGVSYLTTSVETVITTINTPVKVAGITVGTALNERLESTDNNRLTYTGTQPTVGKITSTFAVAGGNNAALSFYIAKNGVILPESKARLRIGAGGTGEREGVVDALVPLLTGDYVELWAENTDGTANLTCLTLNLNGLG